MATQTAPILTRIPLINSGRSTGFVLVDEDDYAALSKHRWRLSAQGYAKRGDNITMAREIMGLDPGDPRVVDHINRDRLDNRRRNLRIVSQADNNRNIASRGGTSQFRGVSRRKDCHRWIAKATLDGHQFYLGLYDEEETAAAAVERFWFYCGLRDEDGWLGADVPSPLRADFIPFLRWLVHERGITGGELIYAVEKPHKHKDLYAAFLDARTQEQA